MAVTFVNAEENLFEDFFPYGAYVVGYNPDDTVKDIKDMNQVQLGISRTCEDLAAHNMNVVWANNFIWSFMPMWLEEAAKNDIRLVPQGGGPPGFIRPYYFSDKQDMLSRAEPFYRDMAKKYKDSTALLAWSVTEEAGAVDWFYEGMAELTK